MRWFSAETTSGKTYYYEENGNESCWVLPNVSQTIQASIQSMHHKVIIASVRLTAIMFVDLQDVSGSSSTAASAPNFPEVSRIQSLPDHLKTVEDEPEVEDLCEESVAIRAPRKHSNVRPLTALPTPSRARWKKNWSWLFCQQFHVFKTYLIILGLKSPAFIFRFPLRTSKSARLISLS